MSWPQIRGLTYSPIGRTLRGTVHYAEGGWNEVWFEPPTLWRIEKPDGTPTFIENDTDEYRFGEDGIAVHTAKSPHRLVATMGLSPKLLFTAHRLWPAPDQMNRPQVGEPTDLTETIVRGRQGWQVHFNDLHGGPPIRVVIDKKLGVTLAWSQASQWIEMSAPVLDEIFDSTLFTWDGPTIAPEELRDSPEQLQREQKMREIAAMPQTSVRWAPTQIHAAPTNGDPLSGALDASVSVNSTQFAIRRWLTDIGEPDIDFSMEFSTPRARSVVGPWTVELRSYAEVSAEDADRILDGLVLPDPPAAIDDIKQAVAARHAAATEAAIVDRLGVGRNLDDYLHGGGNVSLLVRTDFTDDARWRAVALEAMAPVDSGSADFPTFEAGLTCVDNRENAGLTVADLVARIGEDPPYYAFMADSVSMSHPEMPILAVDSGRPEYGHEPGRTFRVVPNQMASVEANLSISNMDFRSFADAADDDGIFRGFPPAPPHVTTLHLEELVALSETNQSTPALRQFADEVATLQRPSAVIVEVTRAGLHDSAQKLDPTAKEIRVGVEDYLTATARAGLCHWGFVQIVGGHWSLVIDPQTGQLEAAMLRQVPPAK